MEKQEKENLDNDDKKNENSKDKIEKTVVEDKQENKILKTDEETEQNKIIENNDVKENNEISGKNEIVENDKKENIILQENLENNVEQEKEENNSEKENSNTQKECSKIKTKKEKTKSIIFHIIAVICISVFCAAIAPKTLQNDTFYTLRIGEYIYNNGISDLTQDLYSWHELPYTYPHWLYDLGMFLIYNSFGQLGIYISTMIFTAILGVSIYGLSNKKSKNKVVSLIIAIASIYLMKSFIAARAQLITFILFVWTVLCIEKFLETQNRRYAIMLILIPLLITNLHCAVFPFYFILFLPYIGEYFLLLIEEKDFDLRLFSIITKIRKLFTIEKDRKEKCDEKIEKIKFAIEDRKRKRAIIRQNPYKIKVEKNHAILLLIAIMAIAALTGFFNPAGDGAYTYLYKTLQGNTTDSINEHLPLTLVENEEFAIAIIVFLMVLIFTDTKIRLADLFMLAGITYLAFNSRRQVSMFALFCGPILASLIGSLVDKYDKETFQKIEKFISDWFGATVVICCFIILSTNIIKPHIKDVYIDEESYPVKPSEWILANLDIENVRLYNEYNYGSYLLFRGIPVFIDSRCDLYSPEFNGTYNKEDKDYDGRDIFSDALNIAGVAVDYETKFEEYGVTHVILYENAKLAMILEDDANYELIYSENNFVIFERLSEKVVEN